MKWYHFNQNNSGGYFYFSEDVGEHVFIQAINEDVAENMFSEMDTGSENWCDCCGQRWYGCEEQEAPEVWGQLITSGVKLHSKDGYVVLHHANGTIQRVH